MAKEVVETTIRARYAETDAMGVVYHTNYLIWFEVGRGEYMRQKGGDYADFEAQGFYLPVSEVDARFIAPARYGDLVVIRTWVKELRSRSLTLSYEVVMQETGQILVTGHTRHICTDREGRVRVIPRKMRELLAGGIKELDCYAKELGQGGDHGTRDAEENLRSGLGEGQARSARP